MYRLEFLPIARKDMVDAVSYITHKLKNPEAADRLANELIEMISRAALSPYINPIYTSNRKLKHEFRKIVVRNYLVFYWIDEENKLVTVSRIIYARRNLNYIVN